MKISREFKVGLVAIIAIILLYWGFNYLKGQNIFDDKRTYFAVYSRVDGLTAARPVVINGFQVGQVQDVYFHPDGSGRLIVKFVMTSDFPIAKNTIASIQSTDLLGEKSIEFILGNSTEQAESGDTLVSNIKLTLTEEVNMQVAPLKSKAENLFASMDTALTLISGFLNDETRDNFMETFNSIRRSFQQLENTVKNVDYTVSETKSDITTTSHNINEITSNLRDDSEKLSNTINNLNKISDSLAQVRFVETFTSLERALSATEEVMRKIDEGEGSLGLLVNDPDLYNNLEDASRQLDLLLLDFKYNPKRYVNFSVFGKDRAYDEEELLEMQREEQQGAEQKDEGSKK